MLQVSALQTYRGALLVGIALLVMAEIAWHRRRRSLGYNWAETATSTFIMLGQSLTRLLTIMFVAPVVYWVYGHRAFDIAIDGWRSILCLFIGAEFIYYWFHRASHHIRWLWASHSVHHSSTRLNFSAAYRLGWTNALSGTWIFFVPLIWIGYSPPAVFGMFYANLFFQFILHTEIIGKLGPLEWIFNTPSNHRVHHASNVELLNHNFGGVLIVFDLMFGTYAIEPLNEQLTFGLTGHAPSYNPFKVALGEWHRIWKELIAAKNPRNAWYVLFGPP